MYDVQTCFDVKKGLLNNVVHVFAPHVRSASPFPSQIPDMRALCRGAKPPEAASTTPTFMAYVWGGKASSGY